MQSMWQSIHTNPHASQAQKIPLPKPGKAFPACGKMFHKTTLYKHAKNGSKAKRWQLNIFALPVLWDVKEKDRLIKARGTENVARTKNRREFQL